LTREQDSNNVPEFDDVVVDRLQYSGESEFAAGDRAHDEFESRDGIDCQVESMDQKKRVRGRKRYALVPSRNG